MTRILLIDDDAQAREMLRQMLERAGYDVMHTPSSRAGLQHYQTTAIDLIITDILMPDQDGLETIQELRLMDRAERIGQLLLVRGWRVSVAESTAGGLISAALLKVSGASRYYELGVVAYSRVAKIDTLGMPSSLYTAQGSVHREAVK